MDFLSQRLPRDAEAPDSPLAFTRHQPLGSASLRTHVFLVLLSPYTLLVFSPSQKIVQSITIDSIAKGVCRYFSES